MCVYLFFILITYLVSTCSYGVLCSYLNICLYLDCNSMVLGPHLFYPTGNSLLPLAVSFLSEQEQGNSSAKGERVKTDTSQEHVCIE